MKKSLILIITIFLCFGLCGCGLQGQEQHQYDEATNQQASIEELVFQVPKSWDKEVDNDGYLNYIERSKDGNIMSSLIVTFEPNAKLSEKGADTWKKLELEAEQKDDINDPERASATIANIPAIKMRYIEGVGSKQNIAMLVMLQVENGVVDIMFYSLNEAGYDDFNKVVDSIKVE